VRYVLSIHTNVVLIVASALGYFFYSGLQTFAVVFLRDRFSIGQSLASTLLVVLGSGAIVGVLATGRIGDALLARHHIAARPIIAGVSFLIAAALFLPALLTTSLLRRTAAVPRRGRSRRGQPATGRGAPGLDPSPAVGTSRSSAHRAALQLRSNRAPAVRLRLHPVRGTHQRPRKPTGDAGPRGIGLDHAFLIMLVPLLVFGLLLLLYARRTYPRDVATATTSENNTPRSTQ